jgi:hypothetical protein
MSMSQHRLMVDPRSRRLASLDRIAAGATRMNKHQRNVVMCAAALTCPHAINDFISAVNDATAGITPITDAVVRAAIEEAKVNWRAEVKPIGRRDK